MISSMKDRDIVAGIERLIDKMPTEELRATENEKPHVHRITRYLEYEILQAI